MFQKMIKDEDIGLENKALHNPIKRFGARGIVLKDDKIALFHKKNKNEYKLPGGGIENGESPEDAFIREVLEETGCVIKIISKLGTIEEFKGHTNFYQLSHVFLAEVVKDTKKLHVTEKEKAEGAELLWMSFDDAIKTINNCFDNLKPSPFDKDENVYATKFIIKRDASILNYYKSLIKKDNKNNIKN
ncbi:MAG: NUDIX hydrolase [Candidatus Caccovivens sp.]